MNKKTDEKTEIIEQEKDSLDDFLEKENIKLSIELKEIHGELEILYNKLAAHIEVLDKQIAQAYDDGNDALWINLTNTKHLLLQNLQEMAHLLRK